MTTPSPTPNTVDPGTTLLEEGESFAAHHRMRTIAWWALTSLVVAGLAAWLMAGFNPSLEATGISWQNPAFVEQPESTSDAEASWVVWDQDSEAWASVLVRNPRPYPVTVSPAPIGNIAEVQVAAFDAKVGAIDLSPDRADAVPSLKIPSGGYALVLLHVSDRCVPMTAGGATGIDAARVNVTTFGITHSLEAPLPATYMAGTTTDHAADPACGAE